MNEYVVISYHYDPCMYAKGLVKPPIKTGQPGFLSLLKCVLQHMWHLLRSNPQTFAVTDDQNSVLQTLRVTI